MKTEDEIMLEIFDTYADLSPENLDCDGERSANAVQREEARLRARLKRLCKELGRDVSEIDAVTWRRRIPR